jgi:hypothetical protein
LFSGKLVGFQHRFAGAILTLEESIFSIVPPSIVFGKAYNNPLRPRQHGPQRSARAQMRLVNKFSHSGFYQSLIPHSRSDAETSHLFPSVLKPSGRLCLNRVKAARPRRGNFR